MASSTEQVASSVLGLQSVNMQTIVLVLLGLIIMTSKTAGILAVVMLGIIIHHSKHAIGSSDVQDSGKVDQNAKTSKKEAKEPKESHKVCPKEHCRSLPIR